VTRAALLKLKERKEKIKHWGETGLKPKGPKAKKNCDANFKDRQPL
jgi:hypothetical protein